MSPFSTARNLLIAFFLWATSILSASPTYERYIFCFDKNNTNSLRVRQFLVRFWIPDYAFILAI